MIFQSTFYVVNSIDATHCSEHFVSSSLQAIQIVSNFVSLHLAVYLTMPHLFFSRVSYLFALCSSLAAAQAGPNTLAPYNPNSATESQNGSK